MKPNPTNMEDKIKNVALSFCCKKDWNSFSTIDERKRFCGSCKHNVVDFTKATQKEFDDAMKSGTRVCGRFTRSQMGETFLKYAAATVVATAAALTVSCETEVVDVRPTEAVAVPVDEGEHESTLMGFVILTDSITMPLDSLATRFDAEIEK
jgi:hypothetical protein